MKRIVFIMTVLLAAGCMRDENAGPCSELCFDVRVKDVEPGVKSAEAGILHDDLISVTVCGEYLTDGAPTRAAAVSGVPDDIGVFGYRYRPPWTGNESPGLLDDAVLTRSGSRWHSSVPILAGPEGTDLKMRFYGYAPCSAQGLKVSAGTGAPELCYAVPEDAADQRDILFGVSDEMPASGTEARLKFGHILSAVTFAVDDGCTDCTVTGISLRGIYCTARYREPDGWTGRGGAADRGIALAEDVAGGAAKALSGGSATMMLIPQTVPDGAVLQITVMKDGETFSLDAPIGGCVWEAGCSYVFRLSFQLNMWDSTFTYHIDLGHKPGTVTGGRENIHLPAMYFDSGTEKIAVDWGDGTVSEYTSSPGSGMNHEFPASYEGDVVVKVRGSSPSIEVQGNHVQCISRVEIEGSDRYDSRDGCNCIIESATGDLVYAGIEYSIPSCVRTIRQFALATVEDVNLVIPEGVTCLYPNAVPGYNKYMKTVSIPASVTTIYDGAFSGNELLRATVDEANPVYDSRRGCGCIMETATDLLLLGTRNMQWPEETRGIRTNACEDSPTGNLVLPSACQEIRGYSFYSNVSLHSISIPAGCHIIGYAFHNCGLVSVDIPQGCSVDSYAFYKCSYLESASLHCTLAEDRTFMECRALKTLDLWDGFSAAGKTNFWNCPLTEIRCHCSTPPVVGDFNLKQSGTLHIPSGADWGDWIDQHGFGAAGWTVIKDL